MRAVVIVVASCAAILSFAADNSGPVTRDEYIDTCERNRESAYACRDQYVDAEIDARRREDPNPGPPLTPEQRKKLRAMGMEEITVAGSGPVALRRSQCARKYEEARASNALPTEKDRQDMLACFALKDCAAKVKCQIEQRQRLSSRKNQKP